MRGEAMAVAPTLQEGEPMGSGPVPRGGSGHAYTVLIIDDNPQLLLVVSTALRRLGNFMVVTAEDGIVGLQRCAESRPDCLVIDVRMPGLDGFQLVRTLRGDPATADLPLVILTAMAQDRDRFRGLASGADQYLLKPIKPLDLVAAIQQAIMTSVAERRGRMQMLAEGGRSARPDDDS